MRIILAVGFVMTVFHICVFIYGAIRARKQGA
jgi:hypothetical protein